MSTSTEADDTLYLALLQVCDRSFFTLVESCDGTRFAALVKNAASDAAFEDTSDAAGARPQLDWLKASVAFDATFSSGEFEIYLPTKLARWLVASMLGTPGTADSGDIQLPDEQMFDGMGEFGNIVCGSWLTELGRNQAFNLASPHVARVPAGWNPLAEVTNRERRQLVCINDLPMRVVIRPSNTE